MTLNIVSSVSIPGGLIMFLLTHTSVSTGPWVLPLIFLVEIYSEMVGRKCLKDD